MTDFMITEDFPKSEIEFDKIFSNPKVCYDYLFKHKWPDGFICKKCCHSKSGWQGLPFPAADYNSEAEFA